MNGDRPEERCVQDAAAAGPVTTTTTTTTPTPGGARVATWLDMRQTDLPRPTGPNVMQLDAILDVANSEDIGDSDFDIEEMEMEMEMRSVFSASLRSSIWDHEYEGGRRYHHYRHGRYPLPNDEVEQAREQMKHVMNLEMCNGKLYNAPIGPNPQKILDLCTGLGLWAVAVADELPSAEVLGVDLSPIQPAWVPPNVRFMIDDVEDDWLDSEDFDFIHMRYSCAYIQDVDRLLRNCYDHLRPGGWIELSDYGGYALCDDGTMPADYPLSRCFMLTHQALSRDGMNTFVANDNGRRFERAGFRNIQCKVVKTPVGNWPKDPKQRLIGTYYREALLSLVSALAAKPLRQVGMSDAELEVFLATVRQSLADRTIHSYFNYISWWGQK